MSVRGRLRCLRVKAWWRIYHAAVARGDRTTEIMLWDRLMASMLGKV